MPARSIFWRLANSGVPGPINEAIGTDQLITVTGVGSNTGVQINIGDGTWRSYTTLPGEVPDSIRAGTFQNPSLAMSLGPLRQDGPRPFVNQFKLAEPWRGSLAAGGLMDYAGLRSGGHVNVNGGIVNLPTSLSNIFSYILYNLQTNMGGGNRWRLMWDGTGDVGLQGVQNTNYDVPNQVDFDYTANGESFATVLVSGVTSGPLTNWRLVNHSDLPQYVKGDVFRNGFVEEIRNYRALRFDNWVDIVQNTTSSWTDRALISDEFWASEDRRIPLEVCVDLCNLIGADMWLCLPYLSSNDFISQCAIMVRDRLGTSRHCYIEYAHKCWDFATPAAHYCLDQGNIMFAPSVGGENFMEWYGVQSANVAKLWRAAWGVTNRLKCVAQTQADWLGLESSMLNAPRWVAQSPSTRRAPKLELNAYGVHAQIDGNMSYGERYPMIEGWRTSLSESQVFDRIRDQELNAAWAPTTERTVQNSLTRWQYHRDIANDNNLELVCVDGGSHLHAGGAAMSNPDHLSMLSRYHWSSQFAQVAQAILEAWRTAGGGLFSWSVHSRIPEATINVGLQRWEGDHNLIWDVVYGWNSTVPGPLGRGLAFVGPFDQVEVVDPKDPEDPEEPEVPAPHEPPVRISTGSITGSVVSGGGLSVTPGTWSGSLPMEFNYKWGKRFNGAGQFIDIPNSNTSTFRFTDDDINYQFRPQVEGVNYDGGVAVRSAFYNMANNSLVRRVTIENTETIAMDSHSFGAFPFGYMGDNGGSQEFPDHWPGTRILNYTGFSSLQERWNLNGPTRTSNYTGALWLTEFADPSAGSWPLPDSAQGRTTLQYLYNWAMLAQAKGVKSIFVMPPHSPEALPIDDNIMSVHQYYVNWLKNAPGVTIPVYLTPHTYTIRKLRNHFSSQSFFTDGLHLVNGSSFDVVGAVGMSFEMMLRGRKVAYDADWNADFRTMIDMFWGDLAAYKCTGLGGSTVITPWAGTNPLPSPVVVP